MQRDAFATGIELAKEKERGLDFPNKTFFTKPPAVDHSTVKKIHSGIYIIFIFQDKGS